MIELEEGIMTSLGNLGQVDGHDAGSGEMNIFILTDQPKVANGVSDFMVEVFGDAGKHARSAVGVAQLPLGVAVEVDATFEIA